MKTWTTTGSARLTTSGSRPNLTSFVRAKTGQASGDVRVWRLPVGLARPDSLRCAAKAVRQRPIALASGHSCCSRGFPRREYPVRRVAKSLSVLDLLPAVSDQPESGPSVLQE